MRGILLLVAGLAMMACVDLDIQPLPTVAPPGQHPIANPSFASDLQPVLTQSCATSGVCHLGPSSQQGLDLGSGQSYGNLVDVAANEQPALMRVRPGQPDSSYLILKLEPDPNNTVPGSRMPSGASPLPPEVIQSFRNWIANGALNN